MRGVAGEGFGVVMDHPDVVVARMSEEHGILDLSKSDWNPQVGDQVRIIPNHVCIVVHLNDVIYGVRDSIVETSWVVAARGRTRPRRLSKAELPVRGSGKRAVIPEDRHSARQRKAR